jgi:demethylmenaquinone methyltransferase / 2-methoxy-6-polyprenyl-1,4-benzoquinol methylase
MELSEKSKTVQQMFDKISGTYDFLNKLLSFRQDVAWRKSLVRNLPTSSHFASENLNSKLTLVDVACGTGDVLFAAQKHRSDYSLFKGFDISEGMLTCGRKRSQLISAKMSFQQANAEKLPLENSSAHAVSISFGLRNVDNRMAALSEFYRVLKPGGKLLVLEFFQSKNTLFAKIFEFYFKQVLPKIGGLFSDKTAYAYLPQSVSTMPSSSEFIRQLENVGFNEVKETLWLSGATRLFIANKTK